MMWVCRPGKHSCLYERVLDDKTIFLGWNGYEVDLSDYSTIEDFRALVIAEKNPDAPTAISNWAGQLYSFCVDMKVGDYVLVPGKSSRFYTLAVIIDNYKYEQGKEYPHSRKINILKERIDRECFTQSTQYSLGAFRTVFKVKQEEEVLKVAGIARG